MKSSAQGTGRAGPGKPSSITGASLVTIPLVTSGKPPHITGELNKLLLQHRDSRRVPVIEPFFLKTQF